MNFILTWRRGRRDQQGGSLRMRPRHCTPLRLRPAISPNVGNSGAEFLVVGVRVRAAPDKRNKKRTPKIRSCRDHSNRKFVPQLYLKNSSCLCFVAQWSERPTGNRKTQVRFPGKGGAVFFSSDPAVSSHLSDRKRKEFDKKRA